MSSVSHSFALLFALLNPFLLGVYMLGAIRGLPPATFRAVLARGAALACTVFGVFAVAGDSLFGSFVPARFASFQIFGGIVFLMIGTRYVLNGADAIASIRGPIHTDTGTVAFLYFVGPGTVSASVVIGGRHDVSVALAIIAVAVALATLSMFVVKRAFDHYRAKRESTVDRVFEIVGRLAGLLVGTFAVDMILNGIAAFMGELEAR